MPTITTSDDVQLHFEDSGLGRPIVLAHGWPLSGEAFAHNEAALNAAGLRVVRYDRRGFGQSDKPGHGYDYDTLAADLNELLIQLDLQDAVLLGLSMGGGDVLRYLSTYGADRVAGLILSSSVAPALGITDDNPDGAMPVQAFDDMASQFEQDPAGFLDGFVTNFFSNNDGLQISEADRDQARQVVAQADVAAAAACIRIWPTDLRDDCAAVSVPTLILHGDGDQNVPLEPSSRRAAEMIPGSALRVIEGGTHGINLSHQKEWEDQVTDFTATL